MEVDEKDLTIIENGREVQLEKIPLVLERQISYFAHDWDSVEGLMAHVGDHPWAKLFSIIIEGFGKDNPRKPLTHWRGIEEDFRDLLLKLTNVDPAKRITAKEALEHRWWEDVEDE